MKNDILKSYLAAIDPDTFLTYSEYLKDCAQHNREPVKENQWNILIDVCGARRLQDTITENQWLENLRDFVSESTSE